MNIGEFPRSLDPKTKALPGERFKDAGEVRDFALMLIRADDPRARNRQIVQGMIDGNRPLPAGVLHAQSQGWRANVNYREAEGQISAQRTPYYDLATENDPCLEVEIDYGRGQQKVEWERTIAKHAHWAIHGWKDFEWHIQLQQSEMCTHGWGSHLHLSNVDWRPTTRTMKHILFPDKTTSCLDDNLETFCVREPMRAHQLYRLIRNEKAAGRVGWKPSNVKDAIISASTEVKTGRRKTSEDYQQELKNNDLGYSYNASRTIWLNHVFVREFEGGKNDCGGITHYIIEEGGDKFLYRRRNRFEDWKNIISLFPYDIGSDGTIHSIRGLGARIFAFCELSNRLKNHMVDSVLVGSGVLLTSQGTVDLTKLGLTSVGPMKLLPPGVVPASYKPMDLSQGPLALARELQQTSDENNKTYRQSIAQSNVQRTAREIDQNASDTHTLQKGAHNMYYSRMDGFYAEILRRLCNPNYTTLMPGGERAVAFQRRCFRDGVPKAALAKIESVRAVRALGAGSAMQRILIARELMQIIYPGADEVSRYNLKRDYVTALANSRHADRYVPPINPSAVPDNDDAIAVLENDALMRGEEALVTSGQNHFKHALRHMAKAGEMLQLLQRRQIDPSAVILAWDAVGPHTAAHLAFLQQDPTRKAQYDALEVQFSNLSKMADKLRQHLEERAIAEEEAAAAQPAGPPAVGPFGIPELDLEWNKMQGQLAIRAEKMRAEMALKAQKQAGQAQLEDQRTAAELRRQAAAGGAAQP